MTKQEAQEVLDSRDACPLHLTRICACTDAERHARTHARTRTHTHAHARARAHTHTPSLSLTHTRPLSLSLSPQVLDRRDADPLYHDFVNKLMPLGLQNLAGPEATLKSWATLHSIYPDTPRKGGVDPAIVYNGDPCAEMLFDEDERKLGLNRDRNNPRNVVYPHGDWSTRIPGVHPIMPAVNSKVVRKALAAANETALRQIQLDRAAEEAEQQLLLRLRRERRQELAGSAGDDAGGEGMGVESDTARRLAVVERWGCEDKEGLSMILWDLTVAAVLSNQSVQLEHLVGTHGPVWAHFEEEEFVADNMTQLIRDGADVNMRQAEANGWTALHLAAAHGGADVCEFLVANCSADPNASSNNGGTPLHYAAYNGHAAVVRRLVRLPLEPSVWFMTQPWKQLLARTLQESPRKGCVCVQGFCEKWC